MQLHAVAVEFQFVEPAFARRCGSSQPRQGRRYESKATSAQKPPYPRNYWGKRPGNCRRNSLQNSLRECPGNCPQTCPGKVPARATWERKLGVDFQVVEGVIEVCRPDDDPPPLTARQIAEAFLLWLREQPNFAGNWVPARLLEDLLYPESAGSISGGDAHTWRAIARHFVKLPRVAALRRSIAGAP